jgi:hypothetical protein
MVSAALWTDVDDDGWPDLLVGLEWGGVRCWRNVQGKRLEDVSERFGFAAAGSGWWNSIAAGDFNGDGRLDYVVGNLGLNTPYQASPARPALLLSGVLDESDREQLLEVEYAGDQLFPGRSRTVLGKAMPGLLRKFPTAKAYAAATLEQMFPADKLAAARRLAATEFRSGVFLSQPDGTWRFEPLPRIAQIAPIFGLAVGDFDGDGHADIYAVQNSFAPIAEVGRFSGGLSQLLRGDGTGHFSPVPPAESGLVVPGDAKGLAVMDLDRDGWPEFVVARNDQRALIFGNTGVAGRQPLSIALRGPAGNPTGIGARVTVEFADGSAQINEVSAGGGYLSQSSPTSFFSFSAANPPRKIRVRSPSGATRDFPAPKQGGSIRIPLP